MCWKSHDPTTSYMALDTYDMITICALQRLVPLQNRIGMIREIHFMPLHNDSTFNAPGYLPANINQLDADLLELESLIHPKGIC